MNLPELINAVKLKYAASGIKVGSPATAACIAKAEAKMRLILPDDFKEFYTICNGFDCADDKFSIVRINELFRDDEYGWDCFIFAERMTYEDVWACRNLNDGHYEIFYNDDGDELVLTRSLTAFLERLLKGHTSGDKGLYAWHKEKKVR